MSETFDEATLSKKTHHFENEVEIWKFKSKYYFKNKFKIIFSQQTLNVEIFFVKIALMSNF